MCQLEISWDACHRRENNPRSQAILDSKRDDFNSDSWDILKLLLQGKVLTNLMLIEAKITMSPTRRFSDLKEYGIDISREMKVPNGTDKSVQHYWLDKEEINRVMLALIEGLRFEKKKKAA